MRIPSPKTLLFDYLWPHELTRLHTIDRYSRGRQWRNHYRFPLIPLRDLPHFLLEDVTAVLVETANPIEWHMYHTNIDMWHANTDYYSPPTDTPHRLLIYEQYGRHAKICIPYRRGVLREHWWEFYDRIPKGQRSFNDAPLSEIETLIMKKNDFIRGTVESRAAAKHALPDALHYVPIEYTESPSSDSSIADLNML